MYKKNKKYLGVNGYNKIKNGQLKKNNLKNHNKAEFEIIPKTSKNVSKI